jgi:exodeoxyribonuclease V gamma subunit
LLNRRLHIDLRERRIDVPDREPVELDGLEQWALGNVLLALRLDDVAAADALAIARASGLLPLGAVGELEHEAAWEVVEPIAARVLALRGGGARPELVVSARLRVPNLHTSVLLTGEIDGRWALGQVRHQFTRITAKHLLSQWIRHLVAAWGGDNRESFIVGRADSAARHPTVAYRFRPVEAPAPALATLARLYFRGLCEPLPFFPIAARAYAQGIADNVGEMKALGAARAQLKYDRDGHVDRVFPSDDVVDGTGDFAQLAREVMLPLVHHLEVLD